MASTYVSVTLTARVKGDFLLLLDASGNVVKKLPAEDAKECGAELILQIESRRTPWSIKICAMVGGAKASKKYERSEWDKKVNVWLSSLRHRSNRSHSLTADNKKEQCVRGDWEQSIDFLLKQSYRIQRKTELRESDEWRLWSETVAANHRTKERRRGEASITNFQEPSRKARVPAVQVCFDWHRSDPVSVVA
jgi:hypothetical protein